MEAKSRWVIHMTFKASCDVSLCFGSFRLVFSGNMLNLCLIFFFVSLFHNFTKSEKTTPHIHFS